MVGDEQAARPQADHHADVQHRERRGAENAVEEPRRFGQREPGEQHQAQAAGETPARTEPLGREPLPHAVRPVAQVAAVPSGSQGEEDPDHDERLARADEPSDEHVDERRDRVAAARRIGRRDARERRRRRADTDAERAGDGQRDADRPQRMHTVARADATRITSPRPARKIGM